jgi:hypothetical protein
MRADIHGGQEHKRSVQGPDTEAQDLSPPNHHFPLATRGRSIQRCHVWTAPSCQGKTSPRRLGRCSHVFGLLARHTRPLARMPSADQVPVKSPHSTMHWHEWVVLIAGSTGSALRAVRPPNLHITPDDTQRDLCYAASATGSLWQQEIDECAAGEPGHLSGSDAIRCLIGMGLSAACAERKQAGRKEG